MNLNTSKTALMRFSDTLGEPFVEFFTGLWDLEEKIEPVDWTPSDKDALRAAAVGGTPMFTIESPTMPLAKLLEDIQPIADYIASRVEGFEPVSERIAAFAVDTDAHSAISAEVLAGAFIEREALVEAFAKALDVESDSNDYHYLRLAIATVLEPTAAAAAAQLDVPTPEELESFESAICPICGSPAAMGVLREVGPLEGSPRVMWCGSCNTNWPYPRMRCTRCGNNKQDELGYRFDEDDTNHRIYTCTHCNDVQKIVSEVKLDYILDPRAEEIAMIPLEEAVLEVLIEEAEAGE